MKLSSRRGRVTLSAMLGPGESTTAILKIPYLALDEKAEVAALEKLDWETCRQSVHDAWRELGSRGATLTCPEPILEKLHARHQSHVLVTDFSMPDRPDLINTSVGTSTYGNFSNESCMIVHELEERGLWEEARARLATWVEYQGTAPQPGNFTDYDGMYFGAGGFECGAYNQHHGWVLWRLCEHYLLSGDARWFRSVLASVLAGVEWVFRQRRETMRDLPHSRGWERGFLPAGSLEDVQDFHYWLSTNALTWRACESCAKALEDLGHEEAGRVRRETGAYREDLLRGFRIMCERSPLVPLEDGTWVPHHPSRLYRRGRDVGWIREVLEGSVYLILSGLVDPESEEAKWILEDYLDGRYPKPPFGYRQDDPEITWFDRGGFSIQPNLLAGLLPHLDRDEVKVFLWMFFNAWASCYRQEIGAMVEHPMPFLGFSNSAHYKTSDQANAVMWLRAIFVRYREDTLHLGKAVPAAWFAQDRPFGLEKMQTPFGEVSVIFRPDPAKETTTVRVRLAQRRAPGRFLLRVRHPSGQVPVKVTLDGKARRRIVVETGDIDLTGLSGSFTVVTHHGPSS